MAEAPKSRLPQEPEYWEALAERIRQDASGPLGAYARAQDVWYGVLSRRASWFLTASVAAMLLLWLALPTRSSSVAFRWIEHSLAPDEPAGTLIVGPVTPSVDALMVQFAPELDDVAMEEEPP